VTFIYKNICSADPWVCFGDFSCFPVIGLSFFYERVKLIVVLKFFRDLLSDLTSEVEGMSVE